MFPDFLGGSETGIQVVKLIQGGTWGCSVGLRPSRTDGVQKPCSLPADGNQIPAEIGCFFFLQVI